MLIQSGKVSMLEGLPWAAIEFAAGRTSHERDEEYIVHQLAHWLKKNICEPYQLLFPVRSRGVEGVTLFGPCLWARTINLRSLLQVDSIGGVNGVTVNGKNHPVGVDDEFVQDLIVQCRKAAESWSAGLEKGSFVRVLIGKYRMLCGKVLARTETEAVVLIALKSRTVRLKCPVMALQTLKAKQTEYFYKGS